MSRALPLGLLVLVSTVGAAASIEERSQEAEQLEATPVGVAYQDAMWPRVGPFVAELLRSCVNATPRPDLRSFVWVANIAEDGTPVDLEVAPVTDVANCFLKGMMDAPFPRPPSEFARGGMPVTLKLNLHNRPPP